jgi:hypothetical protein
VETLFKQDNDNDENNDNDRTDIDDGQIDNDRDNHNDTTVIDDGFDNIKNENTNPNPNPDQDQSSNTSHLKKKRRQEEYPSNEFLGINDDSTFHLSYKRFASTNHNSDSNSNSIFNRNPKILWHIFSNGRYIYHNWIWIWICIYYEKQDRAVLLPYQRNPSHPLYS